MSNTNNLRIDGIDRHIIMELDRDPRASIMLIAERTGLARGTIRARLEKLETDGALRSHSARIRPAAAGRPLRAFVLAQVDQDEFNESIAALAAIPEVIECAGVAGRDDLILQVVARDPDDLYEITQRMMRAPGVRRTSSSIVLREFIDYRVAQLLEHRDAPSTASAK